MQKLFLFIALVLPVSGWAQCKTVNECLNLSAKLTGKKYIFEKKSVQGEIATAGDLTWTAENADALLGEVLAESGYALEKVQGTDVFKVFNARDMRYNVQPSLEASLKSNDELPSANPAFWVSLTYTSKNEGRVSEMARNLRPFMSRYARVIDVRDSNLLIIQENAKSVVRLLEIVRKMDVPLTSEEKELHEARKKRALEGGEEWETFLKYRQQLRMDLLEKQIGEGERPRSSGKHPEKKRP